MKTDIRVALSVRATIRKGDIKELTGDQIAHRGDGTFLPPIQDPDA